MTADAHASAAQLDVSDGIAAASGQKLRDAPDAEALEYIADMADSLAMIADGLEGGEISLLLRSASLRARQVSAGGGDKR